MAYLGEFRRHWRGMAAAALGLASGMSLHAYSLSLFAPAMLQDLGWSKAQFATVGAVSLITLLFVPVAGRLCDLIGVRLTAAIGAVTLPASFILFSFMRGDFREFLAILVVQHALGITTSTVVYTRLIAERFDRARGLALALTICAPPTVAALGTPVLSHVIDTEGWRAGYQWLAAFSVLLGVATQLMIPRTPRTAHAAERGGEKRSLLGDYATVSKSAAFWVLIGGMFLCNMTQAIPAMHMKVLLLDKGISSATAAMIISGYAGGILAGRFICGLSLDRFPAHIVAAFTMGMPALGLFILGSDVSAIGAIALAVLLMGLSQGAEGDLGAYLVARFFPLQMFSSILGLVTAGIAGGTAIGSMLLSGALHLTDEFSLYLVGGAMVALVGSMLFLLLGRPSISGTALVAQRA